MSFCIHSIPWPQARTPFYFGFPPKRFIFLRISVLGLLAEAAEAAEVKIRLRSYN
jgi:hypothetical protein